MMKLIQNKSKQGNSGKKQKETEKCPFCNKDICAGMVWCVYCGKNIRYNLETSIRNKNSKKFKKNLVVNISLFIAVSFALLLGYLYERKWFSRNQMQANQGQTKGNANIKIESINTNIFILASNWDADPEYDGIEFDVSLKNKRVKTIEASGSFSFKLYRVSYHAMDQKGPLITR